MDSDSSEFEELFLEQAPALYRTALRMNNGNTSDAEDLVQETSMKAFRAFGGFKAGTNFRAWVFRIMTNTMINNVRSRKKEPPRAAFEDVEPLLEETGSTGTSAADIREVVDEEVIGAIDALADEYRDVLLLNALDGLTYKEIAESLSVPVGTVMSRLYRARKLLQQRLAGYAAGRNIGGSHGA